MAMNDGTKIEYGYLSINHKGEELCGDHVQVAKGEDGSLTLKLYYSRETFTVIFKDHDDTVLQT